MRPLLPLVFVSLAACSAVPVDNHNRDLDQTDRAATDGDFYRACVLDRDDMHACLLYWGYAYPAATVDDHCAALGGTTAAHCSLVEITGACIVPASASVPGEYRIYYYAPTRTEAARQACMDGGGSFIPGSSGR
jgi:hypothetical protein